MTHRELVEKLLKIAKFGVLAEGSPMLAQEINEAFEEAESFLATDPTAEGGKAEILEQLLDLVRELRREAWKVGYHEGLYTHVDTFHTVEKRSQYLNHQRIVDKILKEIAHLVKKAGELGA